MASPDPNSLRASDPKAAIRELNRGREAAARLGDLLRRSSGGHGEQGELAQEVMMTISRALQALDSGEMSEVCQGAPAGGSSLGSDDGKSEASTGKRKARPGGDQRGGQRRRSHSYARTVPAKTLDDGHTWRKYGQKGIQSAKYPRSYFRCTHKHDQGCQAIRQVQKSEEDPSTYLITYMGHHTCMNAAAKSRHPAAGRDAGETFLITFGDTDPLNGGARGPLLGGAAAFPALRKQESDDDALSNLSRNDSSSEYLMLPELAELETSMVVPGTSAAASDIGDASSGLRSSCMSPTSLDVDFLGVESLRFEDFDFDFKFT